MLRGVALSHYRIDLFLVHSFLDLEQTGLYATAVALGEMLWMVPQAMGRVLFPTVVRDRGTDRDRLTPIVCRHTFWIMVILCGVLALLRRPLVAIFFGREFLPSASALLALLPGILAMSIQEVVGTDLQGRGRPLAVTAAAGTGFVVNLALIDHSRSNRTSPLPGHHTGGGSWRVLMFHYLCEHQ